MATAELTAYQRLLVDYAPRPLRTEAQYRRALRQLERLMRPHVTQAEGQLIELLAMLVEQYESTKHPTPRLEPKTLLAELMEAREITQARLAEETGIGKQTLSNILRGSRGISKVNAQRLAQYFRLPVEQFLE